MIKEFESASFSDDWKLIAEYDRHNVKIMTNFDSNFNGETILELEESSLPSFSPKGNYLTFIKGRNIKVLTRKQ